MGGIGNDAFTEQHQAPSGRRAIHLERASHFARDATRQSDDGSDFPPAHPRRELFTASLFVLVITTFMIWGGWKLIF
jgi:hypothetical protein